MADPLPYLHSEKDYELAMSEYPGSFPMGGKDKYYYPTMEKYDRQHHLEQLQGQKEKHRDERDQDHAKDMDELDEPTIHSNYAVPQRISVVGLAF